MAMAGLEIERLIKRAFPDAQVLVMDLAGDGDHFAARITAEAFRGKSRIQQHQMVCAALQGQMGGTLHALALETLVPKLTNTVSRFSWDGSQLIEGTDDDR